MRLGLPRRASGDAPIPLRKVFPGRTRRA
jgi:hypothetical protein